jgi:hypothetical protein
VSNASLLDAKCRNAAVGSYWDCVNSYNGN